MSSDPFIVRDIDPERPEEIELVARRMRLTLQEVVGPTEGEAMYTMDWLVQRVMFHLDPDSCRGRVLVVELPTGEIVAHCILRVESDEEGEFGLFSTFYVEPSSRRLGIANRFVQEGEAWFQQLGLREFRTYTAETNEPLHRLMGSHGYAIALRKNDMVALVKTLPF